MKIIKENSLANLDNENLVDKIIEFLKNNPFPVDKDFHNLADKNNVDPDILEEVAYAMLTVFVCGGKSKGNKVDISKENFDIGSKIEMEHFAYDTTDKVIKHIQKVFSEKIMYDHTFENPNYYIDGANFKKELETEK